PHGEAARDRPDRGAVVLRTEVKADHGARRKVDARRYTHGNHCPRIVADAEFAATDRQSGFHHHLHAPGLPPNQFDSSLRRLALIGNEILILIPGSASLDVLSIADTVLVAVRSRLGRGPDVRDRRRVSTLA